MNNKPIVVIETVPFRYLSYCHFLLLGFHELNNNGEIVFKIKPNTVKDWLTIKLYRIVSWLRTKLRFLKPYDSRTYCLTGYVKHRGREIKFCYDIADAPYYFDTCQLRRVDLYFKAQCPIDLKDDGFYLTNDIVIPYHPDVITYKNKIQPSMLGPGFKVFNISNYRKLKKEYEKIFIRNVKKTGTLMCYFGNSKGPIPKFSAEYDLYNNEAHLLACYGDRISHPNEKRAVAAKLISEMGDKYDARVINDRAPGAVATNSRSNLFIALEDYPRHIAKFQYNLNISGHRLSIPYRFIFSFAVGTAIITDKLHVKWYQPFNEEVLETTEMGYLKVDEVNWKEFVNSIKDLPEVSSDSVKKEFNSKWTPVAFAQYIVKSSQ